MNEITKFIASLFETFRIKTPTLAAVVLLVLSTVTATAMQGDVLGLIHLDGILGEAVKWVSLTLTALVGGGNVKSESSDR